MNINYVLSSRLVHINSHYHIEKPFILFLVGVIYMSCSSQCTHIGVVDAYVLTFVKSECVLFVPSTLGIIFNPSTGAITDHSQSAKDIDLYFKSQLYMWRFPFTKTQNSF